MRSGRIGIMIFISRESCDPLSFFTLQSRICFLCLSATWSESSFARRFAIERAAHDLTIVESVAKALSSLMNKRLLASTCILIHSFVIQPLNLSLWRAIGDDASTHLSIVQHWLYLRGIFVAESWNDIHQCSLMRYACALANDCCKWELKFKQISRSTTRFSLHSIRECSLPQS